MKRTAIKYIELFFFFFFQAEDGIRDLVRSRGLGDVYKRQEFNETKQYFYAEFSEPFTESGTFTPDQILSGAKEQSGSKIGAFVNYTKVSDPLSVKIGISYILSLIHI